MKTIQQLFDDTKYQIPLCHKQLAYEIDNKLQAGITYQVLNGTKIRRDKSLVRFKLGRSFRIVYKVSGHTPEPLLLTSRQHFDKKINRR